MYTLGPGLWLGKGKTCKMRHTDTDCRTWNKARKLKNEEKEKLT